MLLVDKTDPLTTIQREALRQELRKIKEDIPIHTGIEVYSVAPVQTHLLTPEAPMVCNPGTGAAVSAWTGNPRLVNKLWDERYSRPLEHLFDQMLSFGTAPVSPIFESIQSVAVGAFGPLRPAAEYRRLIIISDLLHNTPQFSQYGGPGSFDDFRRTDYYRRVRPDLRGVQVEIIYLRREGTEQGRSHIEFWQDYFRDSGASVIHVTALQG
ncbi:MAG TPA: hypothetical protein V6D17_23480 [Candidatus Obscuribacterales bacterium]